MSQTTACSKPRFTDIFVERPVVAVVLSIALVLLGARAALELPILQFPEIESSSLQINTPYIGASADVVQGFVTEPIERIASTMPGVDYIDSVTNAGFSLVRVWLDLGEDSTAALAELNSRLNQIAFELPAGAEDPAVTVVRADRPFAAFYLDVSVKEPFRRETVTDYLTREVNPVISAIPGVQRAGLEGGRQPAMRVWLDPDRLAVYDLSTADVQNMLRRNNVISTLGRSESSDQRINLLSDATLQNVEDFEQLIIAEFAGQQVRLADVAEIERGAEEGSTIAGTDYQESVFISIWPLPAANEISIGDELYKVLADFETRLPEGLEITISYDATIYMRNALTEIFITLFETILLVGAVVVLFMGSFRTALVPLVAIPISLLGAMAAMSLMGFSLNLLTILAIVLSVGLVVDDAIVVVENVARYMREGLSRKEAALASSRQLLTPILGMTMTLAAVYAPIGFISGLSGVLFREFAFALATAVLFSGLIAITLSPIMSSTLAPSGGRETRFSQRVNRAFSALQTAYSTLLNRTLAASAPVITLAVFFSLLVVPFYLFSLKELAPTEDQSTVNVIIESAPDSSLEYTLGYMDDVLDAMHGLEGAYSMWYMAYPEGGFSGMDLVDADKRSQKSSELLQHAFRDLSSISGVKAFPTLPAPLPTAGNFDVELVVLSGDSPKEMRSHAVALTQAAQASGKFLYTSTDLIIDLRQARLILDRQRISDLGMDLAGVNEQLSVMLSGNYTNRFEDDGKAFRVIPMLRETDRADSESLLDLQIRRADGERIALRNIARIENEVAPRSLNRFQQNNSFRVHGAAMPGTTKGQALTALEGIAARTLPPGYSIDYAGESRQLRKDGNTMMGVLAISMLIVYLVLAVQFNSFRDPLVVLLGSVPLAMSGAMMISFLDLTTINIYSQVGLITLVGLVAKNAILVVEFTRQLRADGMDRLSAIKESAITRLRPVLMTTGATVLGHFPLVLVSGAGAEARNSIGFILVFGMLIGTFFTLFVLPEVYMLLAAKDEDEILNEGAETKLLGLQPSG